MTNRLVSSARSLVEMYANTLVIFGYIFKGASYLAVVAAVAIAIEAGGPTKVDVPNSESDWEWTIIIYIPAAFFFVGILCKRIGKWMWKKLEESQPTTAA